MHDQRPGRPVVGLLAGWQVYEGSILHSFLGPVLCGVRAAARERGCHLLLACGIWHPITTDQGSVRPAWPVPAPDSDFAPVGPWNTDGLLVVTPLMSDEQARYVQRLATSGHPVVFVGGGHGGPAAIPCHTDGLRQALAHLVEHGHDRVALIVGEARHEDSLNWLAAYKSVVEQSVLASDPRLVVYSSGNREGGRQAVHSLLDSGTEFTAVMARNDEMAAGAMEVLREAGLRIPEDVAVVGFDDRLEAAAQDPPLTTVRVPMFELGYRAFELLIEHVEGQADGDEVVEVPSRLIVRESCGCLPDRVHPAASSSQAEQGAGAFLPEPASDEPRLAWKMAQAVIGEVQHLEVDEVVALCERLAEAFLSSQEEGEGMPFRLTLRDILRRVEAAGDDPHVWQAALSALKAGATALAGVQRRQVDDLLQQARIAVSAGMWRRHKQYVVSQRSAIDRMGMLTADLQAVLSEAEVFGTLQEHLPGIGVERADVFFFEPEGSDPVAWSVLQTESSLAENRRFPSRGFPPAGLYSTEKPFSLALLPLIIQQSLGGFVAFDGADLEPCAAVVRQLAVAIRSVRLYRDAVEGQRVAEEANRMKSRFLSTVSHELRTPLNLIVGLSEMLLDETLSVGPPLPDWHRQDMERIRASAQRLDSLIRDVLDLSRGEMGQLRLTCEPLDPAEVLQPVATVGEQMARDNGLRWRCEIPGDLPRVWGDRARLRQVALNLVSNAVKFTTAGEVMLRVGESASERVSESANQRGGEASHVTISVSDTGLGIPPQEQDVIFDEFRQSERTAARGYGGMGLGLAICRRLVEMHGGQIGVQSSGEEGAGSTFYFTLPIVVSPAPEMEGIRQARRQTVLLLGRQEGNGEPLRMYLEHQGFQVEELGVEQAPDWMARLAQAPPGVVALDFRPDSEQCWEVMKALKGNPATRDVPVLLYSLLQEKDSGAMLEMEYLTKPVGTAELVQALERQGLGGIDESEKRMRTVLVVDDEPGVLEMQARIVQTQLPSCRVLKARNGRDALEIIRRQRPDLVLLDLMMPEMDGFGVLEAMREGATTCNIPVIVLTGQELTEADMERLNRGVAVVLGKGVFSIEETLEHIERALARRQKLGSETQRLVRRAMAYIHEHCGTKISRREIARHVGVSERHLQRCFDQELGMPPGVYLNRYRINRARILLEQGDKTVTQVALEVGFSASNYFAKVFRREVGVAPGDYRRGKRPSASR